MRVLVTGGAGYIGSHTVKELLKEGIEVIILDNFSSGKRELVLGGEVIETDLNDKDSLRKAFHNKNIEAVFHFASLIQVRESYLNPQKYYLHNLTNCLNLLEVMLENEVKNFIFSSSAAVYGIPNQIPIPESHPLNPSSPYGWTKLFIERILNDYHRAYGLNFIALRYFNAAGADPEGELGEMHDPETHLIPSLLLYLLGEREKFELFGTDFSTPDGTAIRDYIHVSDLARAHVLSLKKILDSSWSGSINLGTNRGYSVLEIIKIVEKKTGKKALFEKCPRREGDVPVLLASKDLAERVLGWKPEWSDIEFIVETAWNWHKKRSLRLSQP